MVVVVVVVVMMMMIMYDDDDDDDDDDNRGHGHTKIKANFCEAANTCKRHKIDKQQGMG